MSLRNTQADPKAPLHTCFKRAYDETLKHHHKWAVRNIVYVCTSRRRRRTTNAWFVKVALRATPHRADFYARISESSRTAHEEHQKLDVELAKWCVSPSKLLLPSCCCTDVVIGLEAWRPWFGI